MLQKNIIRHVHCLIMLLSFCFPAFSAETRETHVTKENNKTVISFFSFRPTDKAVWDEINKRELIPGVSVDAKVIVRNHYFDAILLQVQNGNADLFLWQPGASTLKPLIDHRLIKPYTKDLSQMNEGALAGARGPDGQVYGVPFAVQVQSIMVNKKVLKKNGIYTTPKNITELEQIFKKLKDAGLTPMHFAGAETWYISQIMGEVFAAGLIDEKFAQGLIEGNKCFTSPEYTVIFDTLERWRVNGYINTDAASSSYFDTYTAVSFGSSAMSFEGGWMTSKAEPYYRMDPNYEFDFWSVPGVSAKFTAFGDGSYQVATTSKHIDAAQKVLDFTTTKQFAELFAEHVEQLPAYGGKITIKPGDLQTMSNIVAEKSYPVSLFNSYALNRGSPSYNQLFEQAVTAILKGSKTSKDVVRDIQTGLNSWRYVGYDQCP